MVLMLKRSVEHATSLRERTCLKNRLLFVRSALLKRRKEIKRPLQNKHCQLSKLIFKRMTVLPSSVLCLLVNALIPSWNNYTKSLFKRMMVVQISTKKKKSCHHQKVNLKLACFYSNSLQLTPSWKKLLLRMIEVSSLLLLLLFLPLSQLPLSLSPSLINKLLIN